MSTGIQQAGNYSTKTARVHVLEVLALPHTRRSGGLQLRQRQSFLLFRASKGHSSHKMVDLHTLKYPKHTMERTQGRVSEDRWRPTTRPCRRRRKNGLATQLSAAQ